MTELIETALPLEIAPGDVQRRLQAGEKLALIDVREPSEFQLARIEGSEGLIPMRAVPAELSRLDAQADDAPLIVFCHHGVRSLNVVHWLREQKVVGTARARRAASIVGAWRSIRPFHVINPEKFPRRSGLTCQCHWFVPLWPSCCLVHARGR